MVTRCFPDNVALSIFGIAPMSVQNKDLLSDNHWSDYVNEVKAAFIEILD